MNPLKYEAHLFSDNIRHLVTESSAEYIKIFEDFGLLPQYFVEQDGLTGARTNKLFLTNPQTFTSLFFHTDRLVFSKEFQPKESETFASTIDEFVNDAKTSFALYENRICPGFSSKRVSLVVNFLSQFDVDQTQFKNIANPIIANFPWCGQVLNEVKIRTAEKETLLLGDTEEICNSVISINDGDYDSKEGEVTVRKPCFLVQVDTNTLAENDTHRFDLDSSLEMLNAIKPQVAGKVERLAGLL